MDIAKIAKRSVIVAASCMALAACQSAYDAPSASLPAATPDSASTMSGAVSAPDPRAQAAGEAMLAQGGTATDAAIAVMLALTVVEPQSSGIGGGGFMIRGTAAGDVTSYDGRETAPAAAGPEWFFGEDGELRDYSSSVRSGLSVGVPGNIALAAKAHADHGTLAWADLFAPAIALARDGFAMNIRLHESLSGQYDRAGLTALGRDLYYAGKDTPKPVGTLIKNPELAQVFTEIAAAGPDAFYRSASAESMAAAVREATPKADGMTAQDVAGYEAKERGALCGTYRAHRICGMGPPSSGAVAVLQILGQIERFDITALGADNPVTWHLVLESQRLAYADRELYLADSDFVGVPVEGLVSRSYLDARSRLIDPARAQISVRPGNPDGANAALADGDEPPENGTAHLAVIDSSGTMVSYTSTVEGPFGSGLMHRGFYLNNELTDFSRSPESDGRPVANRVEGGKRPRSSMAPTVLYAPDGSPLAAIGAAGGTTIPVQTARSIIGIVDFGMSARESLGLPLIMGFGNRVMIEEGTWMETRKAAFTALGHGDIIVRSPPLKAGAITWSGSGWDSARDPRLDGKLEISPAPAAEASPQASR
ncbi:gamma-glutamyltransferase family protein [Pontixanthobacter sp.]|uniref:gamma-glutamyltransferase family protein n=1 Tax=Pontixanthobacter sp. TaxID=2792078 RepID=UPI003C7DA89B